MTKIFNIQLLLISTSFLLFYFVLEILKRKYKLNRFLTRKLAHIISGYGAILAYMFLYKTQYIFVLLIFFLLFFVTRKNQLFKSIFQKNSIGEVLYPLGIATLAFAYFDKPILFITGIMILAIPDAIAAIAGTYLSNESKKTLVGSTTYFTLTTAILVTNFGLIAGSLISLILTIVENKSNNGFDNFSVPVSYILMTKLLGLL